MDSLLEWLRGDFVVCDLGSSGNEFHEILRPYSKPITLIEIDAAEDSVVAGNSYYKRIVLKTAISGTAGKRKFYQRKFLPCSSFLQPNEGAVRAYGLERYFELDRVFEIDCTTLDTLILQTGIRRVDLLKTDLEGLDFEILNSAPEIVSSCLAVQSELRTQALYSGEPSFTKSITLLENMGFEVVSIKPEIWKYNTRHRELFRDGRFAWGDFILFLSPLKVQEKFKTESGKAFCKQILIAKILRLHNYAAFLFEQHSNIIPPIYHNELSYLVYKRGGMRNIILQSVAILGSTALGSKVLQRVRSVLLNIQSLLQYDKNLKHLG
jgi:FkbM family methyltransferase